MTNVLLDISRLISRVRHFTPSGVDRVEMAYARGLLEAYGDNLEFCAVHPSGIYGRIKRQTALAYLDELDRRWTNTGRDTGKRSLADAAPWITRLMPRQEGIGSADVLVQASPHHLHHPNKVRRKLAREQARFVCMVYDLIPIEFPEYARPGGAVLHERRMASVAELADTVIAISSATGASLTRWIEGRGLVPPPIKVALLGSRPVADVPARRYEDAKPYLLCLGTIEPRKNHMLLLHLWRSIAEQLPTAEIPRLVVIGRRGWENEQIIDLLDRCPGLRPFVEEVNTCGDSDLAGWLRGASAVVMPSFTEGFGLPIAEALSVGTPVIASDIAAHREVGGDVADYLDPLDGPGWQAAVLDHARRGPMHQAQLARISDWRAPDWPEHMQVAVQVIEKCARQT
ncbi:glycosyltransferase family 4 protein [Aurantiacibacter suaedae]|uniref:glycosyltransferase family 4 protein n=1 Tax=Aurantiacibacter suaedae TaxID=2545755 RepID=UPI0010F639B9|nr:glycosyltransferase family 1 protein [Aurantiacibacter suaedae]